MRGIFATMEELGIAAGTLLECVCVCVRISINKYRYRLGEPEVTQGSTDLRFLFLSVHSRMMRGIFATVGELGIAAGTLLDRVGGPEDAVGAAIFLASRAGAFVTGATLTLDGGALLVSSRL